MKNLIKFPYIFSKVTTLNPLENSIINQQTALTRTKSIFYLGEGVQLQFSDVFTNVLQAIAENDRDYLKQIME